MCFSAPLSSHRFPRHETGVPMQPSADHLPVVRYIPPEEFDELGRAAHTLHLVAAVHLTAGGGDHAPARVLEGLSRGEHRLFADHTAPKTKSHVLYKGALQGDSRATFYGTIRIEEHAKATVSDETNRNLILTDKARAAARIRSASFSAAVVM